jgi:hypothetical protein
MTSFEANMAIDDLGNRQVETAWISEPLSQRTSLLLIAACSVIGWALLVAAAAALLSVARHPWS